MKTPLFIKNQQKTVVDTFWMLWVVISYLLFMVILVYVDYDVTYSFKGAIGSFLLIGGTFLNYLFVGFDVDLTISSIEQSQFMRSLLIALVGVIAVNSVTPQLISVQPVPSQLFGMVIGIGEEALIRGFLLTWIAALLAQSHIKSGATIAILASSMIATVLHSAVYGMSNELLTIVFGSFVVIGWAYVQSGYRLSVVMTAHAIINFLAFVR